MPPGFLSVRGPTEADEGLFTAGWRHNSENSFKAFWSVNNSSGFTGTRCLSHLRRSCLRGGWSLVQQVQEGAWTIHNERRGSR